MKKNIGQSPEDFAREAFNLLRAPVPPCPPPRASSLYPPGNPPSLMIFLGPADPPAARDTREQLPPETFLLWLHPPGPGPQSAAPGPARPAGRTLFCPLDADGAFLEKTARLIMLLPERRIRFVVWPGMERTFSDQAEALRAVIQSTLDNCAQDRSRGLARLRSSILNLPSIAANAGLCLERLAPGASAIVCGAGPSLEGALGQLAGIRGRAILISVGHAVPVLAKAGITPDAVVEVDSYAARNWPPGLNPACLLAACSEVAPEVAARFDRALWCEGSSAVFNQAMRLWGAPLAPIALGKTVSVPAIDLALRLGCSRIALVGQDFCLSAAGLMYSGPGAGFDESGVEDMLEVAANNGGIARSTLGLKSLRDAVQGFIVARAAAGGPVFFNCSGPDCAAIRGAPHAGLDRFLADCGRPRESARIFTLKQRPPFPFDRLELAAGKIERFISGASGSGRDQLRMEPEIQMWLAPALDHVGYVLRETPAARSMPRQELSGLQRRLAVELASDLLDDMRSALDARAGKTPAAARQPLVFPSFRAHALRIIGRNNPGFASYLQESPPSFAPDKFSVAWVNQVVPYVKVRTTGGQWLALTAMESMLEQARADVRAFAEARRFDPARAGVVFAVPGSWMHVVEFAKSFPAARVIAVDPWTGLFSGMIGRGRFLHVLPDNALILGVDDALPEWRGLFSARVREWRAAGLEVLFFPHPRLGGDPETKALLAELLGLCPAPR